MKPLKVIKYTLLGIFNAFIVYLIPITISFEAWFLLSLIILNSVLINVVYFTNRFKALKWILPGMIFMISFVVFPAVYNTFISFTNWSTGHILNKSQAIQILESRTYTPDNQKGVEFDIYVMQDQELNFYYFADLNENEISRLYEEDLYQLILHEVGHTLGLNHNFAASTLHNNSDVHNPEITYKEGLSSSVMDYHALNIAPLGIEQGQYADVKPGKYDILAIKYGYTPKLSKKDLNNMLEEYSSNEYLFGNDGDDMRSPGKGIDPRINTGDMTNDPVEYAKDRIILSQNLIPTLYETLKSKSDSWESIYQGYRILLRQIHTSAEIISRQIGGCLLYTSPSPRDLSTSRMPSSA